MGLMNLPNACMCSCTLNCPFSLVQTGNSQAVYFTSYTAKKNYKTIVIFETYPVLET